MAVRAAISWLLVGVALTWAPPADAQLLKLLSPGDLTRSHESIDDCGACHQTVKEVSNGRCLDCHKTLDKQLRARKGTHFARRKQACIDCHSDHKGRDFDSMGLKARGFDHTPTGFAIDGRHKGLKCAGCHKQAKTFRGLQAACGSCHDGNHDGTLGKDCVGCHSTQKDWKPIRGKDDHKLAMTGSHAPLDCVKCHAGGEHLQPDNSCKTCHKDPHRGNANTCTICHKPTQWTEVTFDHDTCAMGLTGKHQKADCQSCHEGWQFGGIPQNCRGCHDGKPKHGDLGECGRCHDTTSFTKHTFKHSKSKFPLTGQHESVDCRHCHTSGKFNDLKGKGRGDACLDCHTEIPKHGDFGNCAPCHDTTSAVSFDHGGEDRPTTMPVRKQPGNAPAAVVVERFPLKGSHIGVTCKGCHKGVAKLGAAVQECSKCHADDDPHDGQFKQRGDACASCHREQSFSPSLITAQAHEPALVGKHQQVDCADCHDRGVFVGAPTQCAGCHLDRHAGRFGDACADCHDPASDSFREAGKGFGPKHDELLTFALRGAHADIACADCHKQGAQFSQATAKLCTTCHSDTHGGAFGPQCADCHRTERKDWHDRQPFDHRVQADFALVASHSNLPCGACHLPVRAGDVAMPLDSDCSECHTDPHGGSASLDCAQCHGPHGWELTTFNHNTTGWPLKASHRLAACTDCHANNSFTGTTTECADCHAQQRPGDHVFDSWQCDDCHTPTTWMAVRFDHSRDAGWALRGAHAGFASMGACGSCHRPGQPPPDAATCSPCHTADDSTHLWASRNCAGCHQPTSFRHVSKIGGFLAQAHPGFGGDQSGLRGAHAVTECSSCHMAGGATMGQICANCHGAPANPPHGADWTQCHDCHDPFPGWPAKKGWRANMP